MTADEVVNGLSIPDELARRRAQRKSAALNECSGTACAIRKPTSLRFTARRRGAARPRHHTAPAGRRKVVLATSIAETSLTIEGVRVVVNSGLARPALRARSWAHPARNRARLARRRFCGSAQSRGRSHHERRHETPDDHLLKSNRRQQCVRMPGKWPDQTLERHRDAWNAGNRPYLDYGLLSSSKNPYPSRQFGSHLKNPWLNQYAILANETWPQ